MSKHYISCARCDKDIVIKTSNDCYSSEIDGQLLCYDCWQKEQPKYLSKQITDLETKLAESERKYEVLYKLFSEQHEIIDQTELECFDEVNRLLKEQKDFYIVEKTEYEKMKQCAKEIVNELKQQLADVKNSCDYYMNRSNDLVLKLAEKDEEIEILNVRITTMQEDIDYWEKQLAEKEKMIEDMKHFKITIGTMENNQVDISSTTYTDQDKIEFAIEQLEKVKDEIGGKIDTFIDSYGDRCIVVVDLEFFIDNQIKLIKGE